MEDSIARLTRLIQKINSHGDYYAYVEIPKNPRGRARIIVMEKEVRFGERKE